MYNNEASKVHLEIENQNQGKEGNAKMLAVSVKIGHFTMEPPGSHGKRWNMIRHITHTLGKKSTNKCLRGGKPFLKDCSFNCCYSGADDLILISLLLSPVFSFNF